MGIKYRDLFPGVLAALKAAPTHRLGATFEWEERGFLSRKTKRYLLTITQLGEWEAVEHFGAQRNYSNEYLVIGFAGEPPPSIQLMFSSAMGKQPGYTMVYRYTAGFASMVDSLVAASLKAGSGSDWEPM